MELKSVKIEKPEPINFILGQSHFIKTVEDLHEALVTSVPGIKFGLAFCEASGDCLVRWTGTDEAMIELAKKNAFAIGAGHSFILFLAEAAFPTLAGEIQYRARAFRFLSQWSALQAIQKAGVDVEAVQPVKDICAISPRPVLLVYGAEDTLIPPGTPQAMYNSACEPVELWIIENAGHENFTNIAPESYPTRLLDFFK